jgi:ABC-type multidrug transport system ATPase subunit
MTSHDLPRAANLADRVDILSHGVITKSVRKGEPAMKELPSIYREVTQDE